MSEIFFIIYGLLSVFFGFFYKYIFTRFLDGIPAGFGIVSIPIVIGIFAFSSGLDWIFLLLSILLFVIYWFDDLFEIPIFVRLLTIMFMTINIAVLISEYDILSLVILFSLFFILVNSINFYDGADLNFSITSILALINMVSNFPISTHEANLFYALLLFFAGFSIHNFFGNLYIGDSGSYILSSVFIFYIAEKNIPIELIILVLSPFTIIIFETISISICRIRNKQKIFMRHRFYLYQQMIDHYKDKKYLIIVFSSVLIPTITLNIVYSISNNLYILCLVLMANILIFQLIKNKLCNNFKS